VRDATADSESLADGETLNAIAEATNNPEQYEKILAMILRRMQDFPKIKHVHKALMLIDFGLDNFCPGFGSDIAQETVIIQRITKYRYYKNGEVDIAAPIRELAAAVLVKMTRDENQNTGSGHVHREEEVSGEQDQAEEDIATPAEADAVQFDDFAQGSVEVYGRFGNNAGRVNGVYSLRNVEVNGKPSYSREGESEDPICMWFYEKGAWMISKEELIGTPNAYALVMSKADTPIDVNAVWKVYDKETRGYVEDPHVNTRSAN